MRANCFWGNVLNMRKLDEYLKAQNLTGAAFARRVGLSDPYLSKIRHGIFTPSLEVAVRIDAETGGKVPAAAWLAFMKSALRRRAAP